MYKFTMYKSLVDCIPLIPLLQFVLDLSYKLFLHYYAAVGKNLTENCVVRSVNVAEILVYSVVAATYDEPGAPQHIIQSHGTHH